MDAPVSTKPKENESGKNDAGQAGNIVLAMASFILFLLIFEEHLVVFSWLQPVGRIHLLIVHFPIVLLLLAMIMEVFRVGSLRRPDDLFERFCSALLLAGVLSAGLAVIMGIFLSHEDGYSQGALAWHKWSGVLLFYLSCGVFAVRRASWYNPSVARAGAVITTVCLVIAGHMGASLTHGEDFILEPVLTSAREAIAVEEAVVFDHVITPIFQEKCLSCHNSDKMKGELKLTDSLSIMKGGKSGPLLVSGRPSESLLMERILLPLAEKKHMPPLGEVQLTAHERSVLYHWIKSGAKFGEKVTALPYSDTLRHLAMSGLEEPSSVLKFDFPAAASHKVERLNSNYRVVAPVAISSPALAVNVYNKSEFTSRTLDELKEISIQVISLQLSKMPVTDEHVAFITRFENLQRLNLNFTDITGDGLQMLSALKNLRSLSLSGTQITYDDLRRDLPLFAALESLTIWDTRVTPEGVSALQSQFSHINVIGGYVDDGSDRVKLNTPRLSNKSLVFEDTMSVHLFHPVKGVGIRYTTDGSDPDSIGALLFDRPLVLDETTAIRARAFKNGWLSSDVTTLQVYKRSHTPDTAILLSRLNRVHTALGAQTFFDGQLGTFNANSPAWANNWAGVIGNDLVLMLKYDHPRTVRSVSFNILVEPETYLFPPEMVEVWGGTSESDLLLIRRMSPGLPDAYRKPFIRLVDCEFDIREVSVLKIIARPVMKLPAWHKRKNRPALLLVDEILIN